MAEFVVTHEALEGFEGSTDRGGKAIILDLNGTKVSLTPKQAGALKQIVGTLIRKNSAKADSKTVVLKERKPKAATAS